MRKFDLGRLPTTIGQLSQLHKRDDWEFVVVPTDNYQLMCEEINYVCGELERLGFPLTCESARQLREIIRQDVRPNFPDPRTRIPGVCFDPIVLRRYKEYSRELVTRFLDEGDSKNALILDSTKVSYYTEPEKVFSNLVRDTFPDTAYDLEETAKCFALDRHTACVFHAMRAMEAAVAVLATRLGATIKDKNGETLSWGVILANLKPKIDALPKGPNQDAWLKIYALLHSCNRAYRTKTAHPVAKYTGEEAETALSSTRSFMEELANLVS